MTTNPATEFSSPVIRKDWAIGPLGERMTLADLPPPGVGRWRPRIKAEVLAAVHGGLLSAEEACARYDLTFEEFTSWALGAQRAGIKGLRTTRVQDYRSTCWRQQRYGA